MRPHNAQPPVVTLGNGRSSAGLDPAVIKRVLHMRMAQLTACYQKGGGGQPGSLFTRFTIDAGGRVVAVTAAGLAPAVTTCIEAVLRTLHFPPPQGGGQVMVSYPFLFRPGVAPAPPPAAKRAPDSPPLVPPPPPPPPRMRCETTETPDALHAALPALNECYQSALLRTPGLAGVLLVTVRHEGGVAVEGIDDAPLIACIGKHLAGLAPPVDGDLAFSLGLVTDSLPVGYTDITLGAESLRVGPMLRRRFMRDWHRPAGRSAEFVDKIAGELEAPKRVLLHGDDDAPGQGMGRTAERLRQAGVRVVLTRRHGDGWEQMAALPTKDPWPAVCPAGFTEDAERPLAVSVVVTDDGIWIGGSDSPAQLIRPRDGRQDMLAYARALRDLKRGDLRSRADAEIAAERGVPWTDLARAVAILHDTGFFELQLVAAADYDPRRD
ncbi:MAG TPA: AgmX/PglI C-terminal domain-containing protein, partial [Kofleriaceae bacterium]|nr:AgmX/PglI C-terminal domain-containing protein [Kofleriaceae bacterium]